jgi:hypothetical protein
MTRVGLDAAGRPVTAERVSRGQASRLELIAWPTHDRAEIYDGFRKDLSVIDYVGGRPATKVGCGGLRRLDGRLGVELSRYDYDADGRLTFVLRVFESGDHKSWGGPERGPYWGWTATRLAHDDDGLSLVEHVVAEPQPGVASGQGYEVALAEAAAAYESGGYRASTTWDARLQRPEAPLTGNAFEGIAGPLADAVRAAGAGWSPAFVVCDVFFRADRDQPGFPHAALATEAFLRRARTRTPDETVNAAYGANPDSLSLDLLSHAAPELLRRFRQIVQAFPGQVPGELLEPFAAEVSRELRTRFPGVRVIVRSPSSGPLAPFEIKPAKRSTSRSQVASREDLAALLEDHGITEPAASKIVADAGWAIVLPGGGRGESRLGGAPVLATEQVWPRTRDGRELHHLATLALHELPDIDGREILPRDGYLSFFADLEDRDALWEPIEPDSEMADRAAIVYTPAGAGTQEPVGPALVERRVKPAARLQLRHVGFGSGMTRYRLDALGESALEPLIWRLNGGVGHQLFGFPPTVQDDPRRDHEISLLHLANDPGDRVRHQ